MPRNAQGALTAVMPEREAPHPVSHGARIPAPLRSPGHAQSLRAKEAGVVKSVSLYVVKHFLNLLDHRSTDAALSLGCIPRVGLQGHMITPCLTF